MDNNVSKDQELEQPGQISFERVFDVSDAPAFDPELDAPVAIHPDSYYEEEEQRYLDEKRATNLSGYLSYINPKNIDVLQNPIDTYYSDARMQPELEKGEVILKQSQEFSQGFLDYIQNGKAEEVVNAVDMFPTILEERQLEETSPLAFELAAARQIMPAGTSDAVIREKAFRMHAENALGKMMGEYEGHTGQKILDFAGFLIPDMIWDLKAQGIEGIDDWSSFINNFQGMEPEEKAVVFDSLLSQMKTVRDGNKLKVFGDMLHLLSSTGADDMGDEMAWDALGAALVSLDVAPLLGAANKAIRANKAFREASRELDAALATSAAVSDAKVAEKIGLPQDVAAMNATAFRNEGILAEAIDGAHDASIKAIAGKSLESSTNLYRALTKVMDEDFALLPSTFSEEARIAYITEKKAEMIEDVRKAYKDLPVEMGDAVVTKLPNGRFQIQINGIRQGKNVLDREEFILSDDGFIETQQIYGPKKPGEDGSNVLDRTEYEMYPYQEDGFYRTQQIYGPQVPDLIPFAEKRIYEYGFNDVGDFGPIRKTGPIRDAVASPVNKFVDFYNSTVDKFIAEAQLSDTVSDKISTYLKVGFNKALEPMGSALRNRKKYEELDKILIHGDELGPSGHRFTVQELKDGVDVDGEVIYLTDPQIEAYYNVMALADFMYLIENKMTRDTAVKQGYKSIQLVDGTSEFGRVIDEPSKYGNLHSRMHPNSSVYELGVGGQKLANLPFKQIQMSQKRLVELDEPMAIKAQYKDREGNIHDTFEYFPLLLVDKAAIKELPDMVIPFREAYVPKINKQVFYLVKEHIPGKINGIFKDVNEGGGGARVRTVRFFDSMSDAKAYAAQQNEVNKGKSVFTVAEDRDERITGFMSDSLSSKGGLFTGARSSREILFGLEGTTPERAGAFEAFQRNLNYISNKYPRNEWRMTTIKKFENTVRQETGIQNYVYGDEILGEQFHYLRALKDYIDVQLRMPTKSEWEFRGFAKRMALWMEGNKYLDNPKFNVRQNVLNLSDKSPVASMRSLAFHSLLGWFNPAQFLVQGMGATVAMSMHPTYAPKAIAQYGFLRAVMFSENDDVIKAAAKRLGMDQDEALQMIKEWKRTGLRDSIKSVSDVDAAIYNYGITFDSIRRASEKGLVFYREGEMVNRGLGWLIARQMWKDSNKGKAITADAEREIFKKSQELGMNMGRANRAKWQEGPLSVPTQFLQIQAKMVETLLPGRLGGTKHFTGEERIRLLLGQAALFGTAGIPFGSMLTNQAMGLFGVAPEDVNDDMVNFLRHGTISALFGYELDIARRGAIASDIENTVLGLFQEDKSTAEALFGAFGGVVGRGFRSFDEMKPMFESADWDFKDYVIFSTAPLKTISTFNNAEKAYFMASQQKYFDNKGGIVAHGPFSATQTLGQALGFTPSQITDAYLLLKDNRAREEYYYKISEEIIGAMVRHRNYLKDGDVEGVDREWKAITMLIEGSGLNEFDQGQIRKAIYTKVSKAESLEDKQVRDLIKNFSTEVGDRLIHSEVNKDLNSLEGDK